MRQVTAIHMPYAPTERSNVIRIGCSGWGRTWDDKVLSISEATDQQYGELVNGYLVIIGGGRSLFVRSSSVLAVEYENGEMPDAESTDCEQVQDAQRDT